MKSKAELIFDKTSQRVVCCETTATATAKQQQEPTLNFNLNLHRTSHEIFQLQFKTLTANFVFKLQSKYLTSNFNMMLQPQAYLQTLTSTLILYLNIDL